MWKPSANGHAWDMYKKSSSADEIGAVWALMQMASESPSETCINSGHTADPRGLRENITAIEKNIVVRSSPREAHMSVNMPASLKIQDKYSQFQLRRRTSWGSFFPQVTNSARSGNFKTGLEVHHSTSDVKEVLVTGQVGTHFTSDVREVLTIGQVGTHSTSDAEGTMDASNESMPQPLGINFYKRIGRWTTHIWAEGKQHYIGSYPTASKAASAYDKASLKHFGQHAQLNYERTDYLYDIEEMATMTNEMYRSNLKQRAKLSKPTKVAEGVTICPKGWYEVKIKELALVKKRNCGQVPLKRRFRADTSKMIWRFLGKFCSVEDAKRCYRMKTNAAKLVD